MRTPLIAGNWKMNTTLPEAEALAAAIAAGAPSAVDVAIFPPFPWLVPVSRVIAGSTVQLGAQNCWFAPSGAFTGEVSPTMLRPWCRSVIVGHSERRTIMGETDELIARKVRAVLDNELTPILCVGEQLAQREAGRAALVVSEQLTAALATLDPTALARCVVAYEPVWAIGTGISATPADAAEMIGTIRARLTQFDPHAAEQVRLLYGGSVTAANAVELLGAPDIDGALVGGASLVAESFLQIVAAARR